MLFNEYEALNELGNQIAAEFEALVRKLVAKHEGQGIPLRELEQVMADTLSIYMGECRVLAAIKKRKGK